MYLLKLHKCKGHQASIFLFIFWFILSFCAIPQLRWEVNNLNIDFTEEIWSSYNFLSFTIFFTLISLMTILSAFHDKSPHVSTFPKAEKPSPELKAGPLNQLFFHWFSPMTWTGFKRPLIEEDIFDINPQFASNELVPIFDRNFQRSKELKGEGSVLKALWKSFGSYLMFSLFLRILIDLIQFAQPFLLGK